MIKFLDLKRVNARFQNEFQERLRLFLDSGSYILGEQVSRFESEFADYCGTNYCVGVSNGLDALKLIFEAYKVLGTLKVGDEVIVPANTYIASVLAISNCGLKPILVEPSPSTFNINPVELERYVSSKTKAVLGVHLYGRLFDVEPLDHICKKHQLLLIEDAAQAHGAEHFDGRKAGNVSNAAAFSFYPTKNLGALGDAGAVTSNDPILIETLRKLRNYGRSSANENEFKGNNCRLDELQASFLRVKLKHLDKDNAKQQEIAKFYLENIKSKGIVLPECKNIESHVFHQFVIKHKRRNKLREFLQNNNIETLIHYPIAVHRQKAFKEMNHLSFPITETLHQEILSLPLYVALTQQEINKIVSVINRFN